MRNNFFSFLAIFYLFTSSCSDEGASQTKTNQGDIYDSTVKAAAMDANITVPTEIDTKNTNSTEIVAFAETLIGVPYKYGSIDPSQGFDCSGFITYTFNHFNIVVPRSSIDFTHIGKEIMLTNAKRGDLILFTGTDSTIRIVGHMGIVTENVDTLKFIHSTSGRKYGVTITLLNEYYIGRFVKVIRVFE